LSHFPQLTNVSEGDDVTEMLNVVKFDFPIPAALAGDIKGSFPSFLIKTDETRIQSEPNLTNELTGHPYYITEKLDGTSATYYYNNGQFGVCSRNLELKEKDGNTYWRVANEYKLEEILEKDGRNLCIQGEVCGPGIQKNPLNLHKPQLFVFNVYDIDSGRYFSMYEMMVFCDQHELKMVPLVEAGEVYPGYSPDALLNMADGLYEGTKNIREGIVVRSQKEVPHAFYSPKRVSFKAINNKYLLKHGDL
jgi:RNA ligase (TIGR02306 family)